MWHAIERKEIIQALVENPEVKRRCEISDMVR